MSDAGKVIGWVLGIYLGFFIVLVIDEVVMKTRYIDHVTPEWVDEWLRIIYWPLLRLFEEMMW